MEFDILETKRLSEIARNRQEQLDRALLEKYDLEYVSCHGSTINLESKYHTAKIYSWKLEAQVNSVCNIDAKDINTVEEFLAMKETVAKDKQNITNALFKIAFIQFRGDIK